MLSGRVRDHKFECENDARKQAAGEYDPVNSGKSICRVLGVTRQAICAAVKLGGDTTLEVARFGTWAVPSFYTTTGNQLSLTH